jgi:Probable Zinc-ribbon domain
VRACPPSAFKAQPDTGKGWSGLELGSVRCAEGEKENSGPLKLARVLLLRLLTRDRRGLGNFRSSLPRQPWWRAPSPQPMDARGVCPRPDRAPCLPPWEPAPSSADGEAPDLTCAGQLNCRGQVRALNTGQRARPHGWRTVPGMNPDRVQRRHSRGLPLEIAREWDAANGELRPADVTPQSRRKVWWSCVTPGCGHQWLARISHRTN